jgi:hypothetical protein
MKNGQYFNKARFRRYRKRDICSLKMGQIMKIIRVLMGVVALTFAGTGSVVAGQGASGTTTFTITITPEFLAALRGGPGKGLAVTPEGSTTVPVTTVVTDTPGDGNTIIRTIETF